MNAPVSARIGRGLEIEGVSKSFAGIPAVKDVSLTVRTGEFVCFLGPSGCGKTTLLRIIAGLEAPDAGRLSLDGRDFTRRPVHERNFAMVFQALALFPHLSVEGNIAYSLKLRGLGHAQRSERVAELLALVRLPGIGGRSVAALSGGQRQRVAIARALAQEPVLFLLDEPLSALDAKLRDHMQVELRELQRALKITTVLVTHDQREAMTIADTIVVMGEGEIQQVGSPMDIYRRPVNRFVAGFIGQTNFIEAEVLGPHAVRVQGRTLAVAQGTGPALAGDRVTLSVRPEHIRVLPPAAAASEDGAAALEARITFVRDLGTNVELHMECGGERIVGTLPPSDWRAETDDGRVRIDLRPDACTVLPH